MLGSDAAMKPEKRKIPVIDLFAGPGGLAEGFVSLNDRDLEFEIALSVEKDAAAHRTLTLRSFYRQFRPERVPPEYYAYLRGELSWDELFNKYPVARDNAVASCLCKELGSKDDPDIYLAIASQLRGRRGWWVLIGGPPCQAYSLIGRFRMSDRSREEFESDARHYLYRNYLSILTRFAPPIFVMENVKGLLSSRINGDRIFQKILNDLAAPGVALAENGGASRRTASLRYRVVPVSYVGGDDGEFQAADFVMHAEEHGVPQKRHRVVLLGVRCDVGLRNLFTLECEHQAPAVLEILEGLPPLRSQLSREPDSTDAWLSALSQAWQEHLSRYA